MYTCVFYVSKWSIYQWKPIICLYAYFIQLYYLYNIIRARRAYVHTHTHTHNKHINFGSQTRRIIIIPLQITHTHMTDCRRHIYYMMKIINDDQTELVSIGVDKRSHVSGDRLVGCNTIFLLLLYIYLYYD